MVLFEEDQSRCVLSVWRRKKVGSGGGHLFSEAAKIVGDDKSDHAKSGAVGLAIRKAAESGGN